MRTFRLPQKPMKTPCWVWFKSVLGSVYLTASVKGLICFASFMLDYLQAASLLALTASQNTAS